MTRFEAVFLDRSIFEDHRKFRRGILLAYIILLAYKT